MAHDLDDKHDMGISRIKSESIIVQTKQDYRPWGISQFPTPKRNMSNVEHEHEHKIAIHITWHVLVSFIWCCQRAAEQVSSHWLAGNTFFFRFSFVFFFFSLLVFKLVYIYWPLVVMPAAAAAACALAAAIAFASASWKTAWSTCFSSGFKILVRFS